MVHHEEAINLTKSPRETAFSKNPFSTQVYTSPASRTLRGWGVCLTSLARPLFFHHLRLSSLAFCQVSLSV